MKAFRRWLIRLTIIAAALGSLMSLVVGLVAENFFPRAVSELDRQFGPWVLKRELFARGWWSSRAAIAAESSTGAAAWRYREHLSHGPLVHGWTRLGWVGGRGALEDADGRVLAATQWWLSPGMTLTGRLDFAAAGQPAGSVDFTLGELFSRIDVRLERLSYGTPATAGFEGLDGSGWATVGGDPINARLELSGRRLHWPGAVLDGPSVGVEVDQAGELIGLRLALSAAHAGLEQSYRDGRVEVEFERLHRRTLEALLDAWAGIVQAGLPAADRHRQLGENLLLAVPGLLQHQPRVALRRLRVDAPLGLLEASAAIGLNRAAPPGYLAEPTVLIPALAADWELALPEALARHWLELYLAWRGVVPEYRDAGVEEMLGRLLADGVLVSGASRLESRGQLADEALTINGRQMPLPRLE